MNPLRIISKLKLICSYYLNPTRSDNASCYIDELPGLHAEFEQ